MDVIEQRKLDRAVHDLQRRGVHAWTAAPPLHRLLWHLGVPLPPPHFMSFRQTALVFAALSVFAAIPLMILFEGVGFGSSYTMPGMVVRLAVTGAATAYFMADRFRSQARRMQLPSWSDLPPDESAAGDESRR